MLTNTALKSDIDALWNKMRDGGLPNPLDSIEQLSFLLFMKRLDEEETRREQQARLRGMEYHSLFVDKDGQPRLEYRWSQWTQRTGADALQFVKNEVFPFIKQIGGTTSGFAQHMANAEFKINKPTRRWPAGPHWGTACSTATPAGEPATSARARRSTTCRSPPTVLYSLYCVCSRCDSERPSRSSFQTTSTSPGCTKSSALAKPERSSLAPDARSSNR